MMCDAVGSCRDPEGPSGNEICPTRAALFLWCLAKRFKRNLQDVTCAVVVLENMCWCGMFRARGQVTLTALIDIWYPVAKSARCDCSYRDGDTASSAVGNITLPALWDLICAVLLLSYVTTWSGGFCSGRSEVYRSC